MESTARRGDSITNLAYLWYIWR